MVMLCYRSMISGGSPCVIEVFMDYIRAGDCLH